MFLSVGKFMTISGRGNAFCFFEYFRKDTIITVSGFHGDIRDGKICLDQRFSGVLQTDVGQICQKVDAYFTAEQL